MKYPILLLTILTVFSCKAQVIVKANDPHLRYSGRVIITDTAAMLSWTGSSIKMCFTGSSVKFTMRDEDENYFTEILDGKVIGVVSTQAKGKKDYTIDNIADGIHTLELFKRTEWAMGKVWFYGFEINGGRLLPASIELKRRIEVFGNSISCGYAVLDTEGKDRGDAVHEDGYNSYVALTARHYNAECYNTSKSGIGVTVSWFPLIMPEMYDRVDANDSISKWDFSKYTPQLVIINLFQNDSWLVNMPNNPNFKLYFGKTAPGADYFVKAYRNFVTSIRGKYPKAHIICMLGSMDATKAGSPWPGYIQKAVDGIGDKNIYTHFIPYKGTPGHPNLKEQQAMADDLEAFIDKTVKW